MAWVMCFGGEARKGPFEMSGVLARKKGCEAPNSLCGRIPEILLVLDPTSAAWDDASGLGH